VQNKFTVVIIILWIWLLTRPKCTKL